MALTPEVYDFRDWTWTYGGVKLAGFAGRADAVTITREDSISDVQGADGELAIQKGPAKPSAVAMRFMGTGSSVTYLGAQAVIQAQRGYAGPFPALVGHNPVDGSTEAFPQAWITKIPDRSIGAEIGEIEFMFRGIGDTIMRGAA